MLAQTFSGSCPSIDSAITASNIKWAVARRALFQSSGTGRTTYKSDHKNGVLSQDELSMHEEQLDAT